MSHKGKNDSNMMTPLLVGAVVGGAIGAVLGLVFAPAEGSQTRQVVGEKLDELTYRLNNLVKSARGLTEVEEEDPIQSRVEEKLIEVRERAESIMNDAENRIAEARHRVAAQVSKNGSESHFVGFQDEGLDVD